MVDVVVEKGSWTGEGFRRLSREVHREKKDKGAEI